MVLSAEQWQGEKGYVSLLSGGVGGCRGEILHCGVNVSISTHLFVFLEPKRLKFCEIKGANLLV